MDESLRNGLRNAVTACRRLLEEDLARQLEGVYGVRGDGAIEPLENLAQLDASSGAERCAIEAAIGHETTHGLQPGQAVARFLRESAFTVLNRLAALKLMEHPRRALIQPSLGGGNGSRGFSLFQRISPEAIRAETDGGYRLYLELLFDDLAQTLPAVFNRSLPVSILFPSAACLREVLDLLNEETLEAAWLEDETIGWIYQYFTPREQREQARSESSAPRDSYELAFRNQFYTPRYVVAFLSDNTLGRLWYEIRCGDTSLVDRCEYMLRPPDEPIYAREKRDPRSLRVLDPACGSGHFLLYCFDLLLDIYREAYEDPDLGPALHEDYPDVDALSRAVPRLMLEHNLHGIDIDLRAVQIASLALWLRAQRAWEGMGVPASERPRIERMSIVCAEPMPGDQQELGTFLKDLRPVILGNLVREVWERMRLTGEAGSLLKIEQELRTSIARAKAAWASAPKAVQMDLFGDREPRPVQFEMALSEIKDDTFWEEAEARVLQALERYSREALGEEVVSRQLFAHDAAQGFALIDLLGQPFDVVLMNPPFGAPSIPSKAYIQEAYPRTKNDLYAAFVERGLELLRPSGYIGAITSRAGFFLKSFQRWREEILLEEAEFIAMADLGYGVLDTAMVETAAYVLRKGGSAEIQ